MLTVEEATEYIKQWIIDEYGIAKPAEKVEKVHKSKIAPAPKALPTPVSLSEIEPVP